jgi:hypothetical protein
MMVRRRRNRIIQSVWFMTLQEMDLNEDDRNYERRASK